MEVTAIHPPPPPPLPVKTRRERSEDTKKTSTSTRRLGRRRRRGTRRTRRRERRKRKKKKKRYDKQSRQGGICTHVFIKQKKGGAISTWAAHGFLGFVTIHLLLSPLPLSLLLSLSPRYSIVLLSSFSLSLLLLFIPSQIE